MLRSGKAVIVVDEAVDLSSELKGFVGLMFRSETWNSGTEEVHAASKSMRDIESTKAIMGLILRIVCGFSVTARKCPMGTNLNAKICAWVCNRNMITDLPLIRYQASSNGRTIYISCVLFPVGVS